MDRSSHTEVVFAPFRTAPTARVVRAMDGVNMANAEIVAQRSKIRGME